MLGIGKAMATIIVITSIVGFFSYRQHTDAKNFMGQLEKGASKELVEEFLENKWLVKKINTQTEYKFKEYDVMFIETNIIPFQAETKANYKPVVFYDNKYVSQGWKNNENLTTFISVMDIKKEVKFPETLDDILIKKITNFSENVKKVAKEKDTEFKIKETYEDSKEKVIKEVNEVGDKINKFLNE